MISGEGENPGLDKTHSRGVQFLGITGAGYQDSTVIVINSQKLNGWSEKEVRNDRPILTLDLKGDCETCETPFLRPKKEFSILVMAHSATLLEACKPSIRVCSFINYRCLWRKKKMLYKAHILGKALS
jgi:hypothetical protein